MSEPNVPPTTKVAVEIELQDGTLVQYTFDQPTQVAIEMKEPDPFALNPPNSPLYPNTADFIFRILDIPKSSVRTKFTPPEERQDLWKLQD